MSYLKPFLTACREHFVINFAGNPNYRGIDIGNVADVCNVRGEYILPGPVEVRYTVHPELRRNHRGVPKSIKDYMIYPEILELNAVVHDQQEQPEPLDDPEDIPTAMQHANIECW